MRYLEKIGLIANRLLTFTCSGLDLQPAPSAPELGTGSEALHAFGGPDLLNSPSANIFF